MVNVSSQTEVKNNLDVFSEIRSFFFYNKPETFRWYLYTVFFSLLLAIFLFPFFFFPIIILLVFLKHYFVIYVVCKYMLNDEKQELLGVKIFQFKKDIKKFSRFYIKYIFTPFCVSVFICPVFLISLLLYYGENIPEKQKICFLLLFVFYPIFFISSIVYYFIVCKYMKTKFITEALKANANLKDLDLNLFYSEARTLLVENVIEKD